MFDACILSFHLYLDGNSSVKVGWINQLRALSLMKVCWVVMGKIGNCLCCAVVNVYNIVVGIGETILTVTLVTPWIICEDTGEIFSTYHSRVNTTVEQGGHVWSDAV